MKKWITILAFLFITAALYAQDAGFPPRPYKKEELARWQQVCEVLAAATPSGYKDHTVKQTRCGAVDWAEPNRQGQPLTVITKKNEPIGNNPYHEAWYTQNEDSSQVYSNQLLLEMKEALNPDGTFDQEKFTAVSIKTDKFEECRTLHVSMRVNVKVDLAKQYHIATRPIKLELPVPAFAYLYTVPVGKPLLNENGDRGGGTDIRTYYRDKALVIIGIMPPKVVATPPDGKSTWREDKIYPQDTTSEISTAPVKNIVVEIDGAEADVRAMIGLIDWKTLKAFIGK